MSLPLGPRWRGSPGKPAYKKLDDCNLPDRLETAKKKYPDNEEALEKIKGFIYDYIDQSEKWIINEMIIQDEFLAYIWAEGDNRDVLHKYYNAERRKARE